MKLTALQLQSTNTARAPFFLVCVCVCVCVCVHCLCVGKMSGQEHEPVTGASPLAKLNSFNFTFFHAVVWPTLFMPATRSTYGNSVGFSLLCQILVACYERRGTVHDHSQSEEGKRTQTEETLSACCFWRTDSACSRSGPDHLSQLAQKQAHAQANDRLIQTSVPSLTQSFPGHAHMTS